MILHDAKTQNISSIIIITIITAVKILNLMKVRLIVRANMLSF
jgi:hypothetical protein